MKYKQRSENYYEQFKILKKKYDKLKQKDSKILKAYKQMRLFQLRNELSSSHYELENDESQIME